MPWVARVILPCFRFVSGASACASTGVADDDDDDEADAPLPTIKEATAMAPIGPFACLACGRLMHRPHECARCIQGRGGAGWRTAPEGIKSPSLKEMKEGTTLYATISSENIGIAHYFVVKRMQTIGGVGPNLNVRSMALACTGFDNENRTGVEVTYFVSLDFDCVMANTKQHVTIVVDSNKIGVCTSLIFHKPPEPKDTINQ
jgi:hypothetical protein